MEKNVFYTGKLYGLTGMNHTDVIHIHDPRFDRRSRSGSSRPNTADKNKGAFLLSSNCYCICSVRGLHAAKFTQRKQHSQW